MSGKSLIALPKEFNGRKLKFIGGIIGEGTFGVIHLAIVDHISCAIKIQVGTTSTNRSVQREIQAYEILKSVDTTDICSYYGYIEHENNTFMILEDLSFMVTLDQLRASSMFRELLTVLTDVAKCIDAVHRVDLVHNDIKLDNILVNVKTGNIKLIDFGSAMKAGSECITSTAINSYTPPERIYTSDNLYCTITPELDTWSFGCVVYYMYTGNHAFDVTHKEKILDYSYNKYMEHMIPDHVLTFLRCGAFVHQSQRAKICSISLAAQLISSSKL